jgi:hypothetical protein
MTGYAYVMTGYDAVTGEEPELRCSKPNMN